MKPKHVAQQRAEGQASLLSDAKAVLQELGIAWGNRWSLRRHIQRALVGDDAERALATIRSASEQLLKMEKRVVLAMEATREG